MSIIWAILFLVGGLVILWKSAHALVAGAVSLAERLGVSPLVIGFTVVAMGTSAPEVAASIAAAVKGAGDIAIGNVYGSNIANLALVGGLAALIRPIRVRLQTSIRELPVMLVTALVLWPVLRNLQLSRAEGIFLLILFAALLYLTVYFARKEPNKEQAAAGLAAKPLKASVFLVLIGLAGLAVGADITVRGAVVIGEAIGLSKAVIGLTIIAIGTSLPELMTCVVAAVKKQDDISIGNLVGSNVFNTLLVTGTAGTIRPFGLASRLAGADYWVMVVVSAAFIVLILIGRRSLKRPAGVLLLTVYMAYMVYLFGYTAGK